MKKIAVSLIVFCALNARDLGQQRSSKLLKTAAESLSETIKELETQSNSQKRLKLLSKAEQQIKELESLVDEEKTVLTKVST